MYSCLLLVLTVFSIIGQLETTSENSTRATRPTWATTTLKSTTTSRSPTTLKQPSITSTNIPVQPKPILITVTPNTTVYFGDGGNLTCTASGLNLPKIQPYELIWFGQGEGGSNEEIVKVRNSTVVVLNRSLVTKYSGHSVFCALIFNHYAPRYYWAMNTKHILIEKSIRFNDSSIRKPSYYEILSDQARDAHSNESRLSKVMIASITGIAGLFVLTLLAGLLYKRLRKRKIARPPIEEEPSKQSQENIYTYIPLQTVPFYEAKAMVAANMKIVSQPVKPPPLPKRPRHHRSISEEDEYIYSYP